MSTQAANVCPEHPNGRLVEDYRAGDMICRECGLVVGDRVIDVGQEWRTFANDSDGKDRSRVGDVQNSLLSGSDLSTVIGMPAGKFTTMSDQSNSLFKKRGNTAANSQDKALLNGFREISTMADRIALVSSIVDLAKLRFKEVYVSKILKGRSTAAICAACIFIACREQRVPRAFKEIVAISRVPKKDIGRCFKTIIKSLPSVQKSSSSRGAASNDVVDVAAFMPRFCSNLHLPVPVQMCAAHIAGRIKDLDLASGRNPLSITAVSIFLAATIGDISEDTKERPGLKKVCDVCGVAESTAKVCYKLVIPKVRELFPPTFTPKIPNAYPYLEQLM